MRVVGTISTTDNLCDFCVLDFPTCPKAVHIKFGNGRGNDNVIECSECKPFERDREYYTLKPELGIFPSGETR
jgi:hypothetical protein